MELACELGRESAGGSRPSVGQFVAGLKHTGPSRNRHPRLEPLGTRVIFSQSHWPTSPAQISPVTGWKVHFQGLRAPSDQISGRWFASSLNGLSVGMA